MRGGRSAGSERLAPADRERRGSASRLGKRSVREVLAAMRSVYACKAGLSVTTSGLKKLARRTNEGAG
jgi:hypothetical protein